MKVSKAFLDYNHFVSLLTIRFKQLERIVEFLLVFILNDVIYCLYILHFFPHIMNSQKEPSSQTFRYLLLPLFSLHVEQPNLTFRFNYQKKMKIIKYNHFSEQNLQLYRSQTNADPLRYGGINSVNKAYFIHINRMQKYNKINS